MAAVTVTRSRRVVDWLFRSRETGRLTVVQPPNVPLVVFVVCRLVELALTGRPADALRWIGSAALLWWAVDEVARGVNPFRRGLGALVLVGMAVSAFLRLH